MPKKRKDGRQERKVTINGKRISVYGHSADEIDEKVAKLKEDAEMGIKADKAMTVDDMYDAWKKTHYHSSESTAAEYDKKYKAIHHNHIGKLKLTEVNHANVHKAYREAGEGNHSYKRGKTGKTDSSVRESIAALSC